MLTGVGHSLVRLCKLWLQVSDDSPRVCNDGSRTRGSGM